MNAIDKIALTKIFGVGPRIARSLLAHCGSTSEIFSASKKELKAIPGIGEVIANTILSKSFLDEAEKELAFVEKHAIEILWIEDEAYPKRLKQCDDAPLVLYYKGQANLNNQHTISIVGTRNATGYGKRLCEELVGDLQAINPLIVSGLAYGIDVTAHRTAIKQQLATVGVMGHGIDRIYPAAHRDIAARMLENGGLLTEFPSGTLPDRVNFPMRNRIIAGMADVTIVVEAASKGGALITAEIANSYNRDVCTFPGSIDQPYSAGCNYLIKTHRAHLIRNVEDLLYLMNWEKQNEHPKEKQLSLITPAMSKDEQKVYNFLVESEQATVDDIALHCDWPQSKLAIILLEMEMNNIIISLPGKVYRVM